jgi:probable HAF family extracellular repeat protein
MSNANRTRLRITAAAVAVGGFAIAGSAIAVSANAAPVTPAPTPTPTVTVTPTVTPTPIVSATATPIPTTPTGGASGYGFVTLDNANDFTFNQLLGINNDGVIAGYFGSGAPGHPNKGYLLFPPYGQGNYVNENFPGSVQTQVTGLNDRGVTVGFWSSMNNANMVNDNHGFYVKHGKSHNADFPAGSPATPPVDQLLGVNDNDVAVGFYTDANGINHGYKLNIDHKRFSSVTDPNAPAASLTAAAINSGGDIAGFYTSPATGNTDGFLKHHGQFIDLAVPGASSTMALGVNDHDEVVGVFTTAAGATHGFTWTPGHGFTTVNDPNGAGTTTINGVNNAGDLVGFYVDANGNTDGLLATPAHKG